MSLTFGGELRRAMVARGVTNKGLAQRVNVRNETISILRHDRMMPSHGLALRLAEALTWEGLASISLARRLGSCELCGASFVSEEKGGPRRRYCKRACTLTAQRQRNKEKVRESAAVVTHRLHDHQEAVRAMCMSCADGQCPDGTCALRGVSPFPLAKGQDLLFRERVA